MKRIKFLVVFLRFSSTPSSLTSLSSWSRSEGHAHLRQGPRPLTGSGPRHVEQFLVSLVVVVGHEYLGLDNLEGHFLDLEHGLGSLEGQGLLEPDQSRPCVVWVQLSLRIANLRRFANSSRDVSSTDPIKTSSTRTTRWRSWTRRRRRRSP